MIEDARHFHIFAFETLGLAVRDMDSYRMTVQPHVDIGNRVHIEGENRNQDSVGFLRVGRDFARGQHDEGAGAGDAAIADTAVGVRI